MRFMSKLDFPGNVRQLENLCNWITVMAPGQTVELKDLPQELLNEHVAETERTASVQKSAYAPAERAFPMPEGGEGSGGAKPSGNGNGLPTPSSYAGAAHEPSPEWSSLLDAEASQMLSSGQPEVMDVLSRRFEATLIKAALRHTHGRKNDAAIRLGIGRNTITRKIQELNITGAKDD